MRDADLMKLYSARLLALAAAIPHAGRLEAADGSGTARSVQCGSVVTVDVALENGRIVRFAQEVRACALGQAAAAAVGGAILGRSAAEVAAAREALAAMLAGGPVPPAPFDALEALLPAQDYPNRHASVLLSLDATLKALDAADR